MSQETIHPKLAIVEDDTMVAQLLKNHIERCSDIQVLYVANNGNEFFERLANSTKIPEVVLLDLRMKNGNGLEVLEKLQIAKSAMKTIVMSSHYDPSYLGQMLKLGCSAFLPKELDPDELILIIKKVYQEGFFFTEDQVQMLRKQIASKSPKLHLDSKTSLSQRELEVLQLIAKQLTNKEIGERLFISTKTVEMHKSNLFVKTGAKNAVGLVMYAIQNQLIDPNDFMMLN
ncbi:MAG: response regulator transcription factor [Bacteroidota bacterium]